MSNFSFTKFSQKLGVLDLWNLVEPLREPMLLNKVLWAGKEEENFIVKKRSITFYLEIYGCEKLGAFELLDLWM